MVALNIYVDDRTEEALRRASLKEGRTPEALAAAAVENYMADWARRNSAPTPHPVAGYDYDGSIPERGPQPEWG